MKKVVAVGIAILVLAITLVACSNGNDNNSSGNTNTPSSIPSGNNSATTPTASSDNNSRPSGDNNTTIQPPLFNDRSIETAITFADYFVLMLNEECDLTGDEGAINSWNDLFDFGQTPIYHSNISEVEHSENLYQFDVNGIKGQTVNSTRVLINLQGDEPFYFCAYTRYYPYVLQTASSYVSLMAEGDVNKLARWLSADGGPEPSNDFIRQAESGLSIYSTYDLHDVVITGIQFDNDAQRFFCNFKDAQGVQFEVALSFGDGLIGPARLD